MPQETVRFSPSQRITLHFVKGILWILGKIPIRFRAITGGCLGFLIGGIPFREQRIALLQISKFLSATKAKSLTREVFASVGQTLFESLNLQPFLKNPHKHIECPDLDYVDSLLAKDEAIVALTGHTGNWDLLAAFMVSRGVKLSTVGREARNPVAHRILDDLRSSYGVKTLWRGGSGSREVLKELSAKRTVAALIDQDTSVASEYCDFFGVPAKTPSGLVALAKKKNVTLVTTFIVRIARGKYLIRVQPLDLSKSIREILCDYNNRLEQLIREHPEQWVWFHKRWRSAPDGTVYRTSEYIDYLRDSTKSCQESHSA